MSRRAGRTDSFARIQRLTTLLHETKDREVRRECRRRLARLRKRREEPRREGPDA